MLIVLDGSLFAEHSGVQRFCREAAGGNWGAVCRTADGPASGDGNRVGGWCLRGGVSRRVGNFMAGWLGCESRGN